MSVKILFLTLSHLSFDGKILRAFGKFCYQMLHQCDTVNQIGENVECHDAQSLSQTGTGW